MPHYKLADNIRCFTAYSKAHRYVTLPLIEDNWAAAVHIANDSYLLSVGIPKAHRKTKDDHNHHFRIVDVAV